MPNTQTQPQPDESRRIVLECESGERHPAHTWLILITSWDAERISRYYCPGTWNAPWSLPPEPKKP